jgi:prolyl-tRNA synthetase
MDAAGALEVSLPVVQPRELWEEAGRWQVYGKELGRFQDRHDNEYCLQPTSEEAVTDLLRRDLKSYRQLPINFYQIQTKFRDEIRPRFGVMRGREFIMKDAYSFDADEKSARASYEQMRRAYRRIFIRTGLDFRAVEADTGAIGGNSSEEFMVLAQSGEAEVISCSQCDYAANQEMAKSVIHPPSAPVGASPEVFATPGLRTIEDLAKLLRCQAADLAKSMIVTDGKTIVLVVLRGDHELNLVKLEAFLAREKGMKAIRLARDDEMKAWSLPAGSLGPYQFPHPHLLVIYDALSMESGYVVGANQEGFHVKNVSFTRDARTALRALVRDVKVGEACPNCSAALQSHRGIEVGHVFYLGKKYSKAMNLKFSSEKGSEDLVEMGCYGIGVGRTVAACIEQNHDDFGIVWPVSLAPYPVGVSFLGEGEVVSQAEKFYQELRAAGIDAIFDDRPLSAGVKLKDMDLVGIPIQLIVGDRAFKEGNCEIKLRRGNQKQIVALTEALSTVKKILEDERRSMDLRLAEVDKHAA